MSRMVLSSEAKGAVVSGLEVEALTKSFGPIRVLSDVSFSLGSKETLAVHGPSGSGKSTLLKLIAGLELPEGGDIRIGGVSCVGTAAADRPVSYLLQNPKVHAQLSVADNVAFSLRARRFDEAVVRDRLRLTLEAMGLLQIARRQPAQCSDTDLERVVIARALSVPAAVYLLDELPGGQLATARAQLTSDAVAFVRRQASCAVVVTHDLALVEPISDRVLVLS